MKIQTRKISINLISMIVIIFIFCSCVFINYNSTKFDVYQLTNPGNKLINQSVIVNDNSLVEKSTLANLNLNISKLPTVNVNTDYAYEIDGEDNVNRSRPQIESDTVQQPIKSISFLDLPYNQKVDIEVEAFFDNCGTLDGQNVDMKIVYTDFYSAKEYIGEDENDKLLNNSKVLWWTSYGSVENQSFDNEWYQRGFESINMKIYFYIDDTEKSLELNNAYFSLYGLEGDNIDYVEGISSKNAAKVYLYENSTVEYKENIVHGEDTYNDVYCGTKSISNIYDKTSAVSFLYKNVDYIDLNLHMLANSYYNGYHINFSALSPNFEGNAMKEVSTTEAMAGEEILYTIYYDMPLSENPIFTVSSLVFSDTLDNNLIYKDIKIYDENNNDITNTAGTLVNNNNMVEYSFNSTYLSSIVYAGQQYKFIIKANIVDNPTVNHISNSANIIINNENVYTTNSANIDLISYVIVRHFDEYGNELQEPVTLKGKLYEEYNAEAGGYLYYEITELPENASGTFLPETQEVKYTYFKTVTDYEVYKVWVDDNPTMGIDDDASQTVTRPNSIKLRLSSNLSDEVQTVEMTGSGQNVSNPYGIMTLDDETEEEQITDGNVWYYKFENLPRFDENNEEIKYSVTEFDVPEGYYMSTCLNEEHTATIANVLQTGTIIINSYDSYTNEPLEGTVFKVEQIYEGKAYLVGEYTTNSAGMAIVTYINNGTFRITQIKAVDGYSMSPETFEATISRTEIEAIVNVPNKTGLTLPETGGSGIKKIVITGCCIVLTSLIFINRKKETKKGYNLRHRY